MEEEIEQEYPASDVEDIIGTKKDPFSEVLDGGDGTLSDDQLYDQPGDGVFTDQQPTDQPVDGTLTDEQPIDQPGDGSLTSGLTDLELLQIQELIQQQSETTTSISVDDFAVLLHAQTVELSSVILFCALLITGAIASIKLWGGHWSGS